MVELYTLAEHLGKSCATNAYATGSVLKRAAAELGVPGEQIQDFELLPLIGPQTEQTLPVIHGLQSKQLLLWSSLLGRVVDLAKIRSAARAPLACHLTMLEYSRSSWAHRCCRFLWSADLLMLAPGDMVSLGGLKLGELVGKVHLAGSVEQTVFRELMSQNHAGAIL